MKKKSILFVVDKPDWAYEFMVKSWLPYLLKEYDCYIAYQQDFTIKLRKSNKFFRYFYNLKSLFISKINTSKTTYFLHKNYIYKHYNRPPFYKFTSIIGDKILEKNSPEIFDFKIEMAFYFQYTSKIPFIAKKNVTGIFTDCFPHEGPTYDIKSGTDRSLLRREQFYEKYLKPYDHIIVGGGNLLQDYQKLTKKVSFVYGIYGETLFQQNPSVGDTPGLTVGWTGNPNRPMKGFQQFIEPSIENLKAKGFDIKLKTKFSGNYEELYSFYKDVDLIVIASSADSGPSLFAEAALSAVPTISTKVGLPLMGIIDGENGLFVERNIKSIEKAIIDLYDNREKLKQFSSRIKTDYLTTLETKHSVGNL